LYICVCAQVVSGQSADALFADRSNLASARSAADMWRARLGSNPQDYESAWKLARADYWLGNHVPESERRHSLEEGIEAGQKASSLQPRRPEGHFWTAANMGALAESSLRAGLKYRKSIKDELETVLKIDPAFEQGSADRALGRWYYKVPRLFGGSIRLAEEHLRASLKYNPNNIASHFFLAEALLEDGRKDEARAELQKVLEAPFERDWAPEDRDFKEKARRLLERLKSEV
jgi:tetratricopeptide (TPR) repeat protein